MAEPHWTSYVGIVTGTLGMIIAGISLRMSHKNKALDLRLELRKIVNEVERDLGKLDGLLEHANKSRRAVAAATGILRSGAMQLWDTQFAEDKKKLVRLTEKAPSSKTEYDKLRPVEIESQLIAVHGLQSEVYDLTEKYQAALKADDEARKQIKEDVRAMTPRGTR